LHGIEQRIDPPAEHRGSGYEARGVPRIPKALWEAGRLLEESALGRQIFGEDVVDHYVNTARVEQEAYDSVVTCWERRRYLERG
jgi:glutamine synthetase